MRIRLALRRLCLSHRNLWILIVLCLGLSPGLPVPAQNLIGVELIEVERTRIGLGAETGEIGVERGGEEDWKPLFFDVDPAGLLHLPDFYKGRIAVFDTEGRLVEQKPCPEGISPRLNFFCLAPDGGYVTFGDHHLYRLRGDGTLAWKRDFGFGAVPHFILANEVGIFVVPSPGDRRALVFDYGSDRPLGRFGISAGGEQMPAVVTAGGKRFAFQLSPMREREAAGSVEGGFRLPREGSGGSGGMDGPGAGEAFLVRVAPDGRSLWKRVEQVAEHYYIFSPAGELIGQGAIFPPEGAPGTGFWTAADSGLDVYKNYFFWDRLEIVRYRLR